MPNLSKVHNGYLNIRVWILFAVLLIFRMTPCNLIQSLKDMCKGVHRQLDLKITMTYPRTLRDTKHVSRVEFVITVVCPMASV